MRPILFICKDRPIYSYRLCLLASIVLFSQTMAWQVTVRGLPLTTSLVVTAVMLSSGLLGARLLFVLSRWRNYRRHPERIWARGEFGASLFGGVLALYVIGLPGVWLSGLPRGEFLDALATAALVAFPLGRTGCLLHGCCGGRCRPWITPALEIAGVVALALMLLTRAPMTPGLVFLIAFSSYPALRWVLDFWRKEVAGGVSLSQRIALATSLLNLGAILFIAGRG